MILKVKNNVFSRRSTLLKTIYILKTCLKMVYQYAQLLNYIR